MDKVISEVKVNLKMWSTVVFDAEEIKDIYPEFAGTSDFESIEDLKEKIQEYMDMNYLDHIMYSDGAMNECTVEITYEEDENE